MKVKETRSSRRDKLEKKKEFLEVCYTYSDLRAHVMYNESIPEQVRDNLLRAMFDLWYAQPYGYKPFQELRKNGVDIEATTDMLKLRIKTMREWLY